MVPLITGLSYYCAWGGPEHVEAVIVVAVFRVVTVDRVVSAFVGVGVGVVEIVSMEVVDMPYPMERPMR